MKHLRLPSFTSPQITGAGLLAPTHMLVMALVVGILGGFGAVAFRWFIHQAQRFFWQADTFDVALVRGLPWYWVIGAPAVGGLVVGLIVHRFAAEAKGHGVPEVLEAVALRQGRIRPRLVIAKLVASGITIGSGGSVGREGPIVQIGSSLGSTLAQWLRLGVRRRRTLVACGAAAGIAATFNAPVAGAFFAVEIILGDFGVPYFSPIVVSSVSATVISRLFLGNAPAFAVPAYSLRSPAELLFYAVLGLAAGLIGLVFLRSLYGTEDLFDRLPLPLPLRSALGGLAVGALALKFPEVLGVGYEAITQALTNQLVLTSLLLLMAAKIAAVSLTLGSGGSGGVFAPSLFIGATLGGLVGGMVHGLWPDVCASPGAYALVGMGAVVGATTHAPITAILIIFELTNDYKIILPLMISCIIATALSMRLEKASIYTMKLLRRGIDIQKREGVNVLRHLRVRDAMREQVTTVRPGAHLLELVSLMVDGPGETLFVVDDDARLHGIVTTDDLRPLLKTTSALDSLVVALDIMRTDHPQVDPEAGLDEVMKRLASYRHEVPVVADGRLLGAIWPEDVIARYNEELFKRDMASSMALTFAGDERMVDLPGTRGLQLAEMPVPRRYVGKTLREIDLRQRFASSVLLVRRQDKDADEIVDRVPDGDFAFADQDTLLVLGPADRLRALMAE
ncbi:MAG: chloride channel protein [Candidatus Krumholzibacteriia bacterium]